MSEKDWEGEMADAIAEVLAEAVASGPESARNAPSDSKSARFVRSRTPPFTILAASKNKFEDILVVPVVGPKHELIQIGLEVFRGHPMVYADDRSLEQAPEALNALCVDVPVDVGLGVVDCGMGVSSRGSSTASEFVGAEEFGVFADDHVEHFGECFGLKIRDNLSTNIAVSLLHSDNDCLSLGPSPSWPLDATADISVISFDDTSELIFEPIPWSHGNPYLHSHSPGGLVGDSKSPFELLSADAFLGFHHQPDGDKPLLKGRSGTMKDSAGSVGELMFTSFALPEFTSSKPVGVFGSALWARDTIGPTHFLDEVFAFALGGEAFLEFDYVHDSSL